MKPSRHLLLLTVILLVGAGLRFHALGQDRRFHPDEAWFSAFARHAALNGDWLLHGPLDKTPLSIYASALSMTLFASRVDERGLLNFTVYQGEFAARLPNVFASVLLIAVVYALARRLYHQRPVALWAALFTALSPSAVTFSATAFTDGLMLTFMTIGLHMASAGRWSWSAIWLVLAFATKQQALFYVPLALALGWVVRHITFEDLFRFILPYLLGLGALLLWDRLRAQIESLWVLAYLNNSPARLIRADETVPRLVRWLENGRNLLGATTPLFAVTIPLTVFGRITRAPRRRATAVDIVLLVFVLAYVLLHWLVAFNTYDRYLLPLLVPFALLSARAGMGLWHLLSRFITRPELSVAAAAVLFALFTSAFEASEFRLALGGEETNFPNYQGIDVLAEYLNSQSLGAIVYDHWLTWELGYYMGEWSDKRRVYYPTPDALVADALLQPDPAPRYFPASATQSIAPWLDALRAGGFTVSPIYETAEWVVYELIPPHQVVSAAGSFSLSSEERYGDESE